jgi:hypothetical protein
VAADPDGEALQGKAQSRSRGTDEAASEAALNSGFAATVIAVPTVAMMTSGRSFTKQPHQPTRLRRDALEFPDGETMLPTYLMEGQQATVLQLPACVGSKAPAPQQAWLGDCVALTKRVAVRASTCRLAPPR